MTAPTQTPALPERPLMPSDATRSDREVDATCTAKATAPGARRAALVAPASRRRGRFLILGEQGRGGMGVVSRAWDRRRGELVALKELAYDAPVARERLEREAALTATLRHSGIVSVFDIDRFDDGAPFYTMQLVRGGSLRAAIESTRAVRDRLALVGAVVAVCDAMAYAHAIDACHFTTQASWDESLGID